MVGVSVGPYTSGERTERIALILSICLEKERQTVPYECTVVDESRFSVGKKIVADNDLVEEVPAATVDVRAYAVVEFLPERIEETAGFYLTDLLFRSEHFGTAFVVGIIVEVAH